MYSKRKKSYTIHCLRACTLSEKEAIALETLQLKELQVLVAQLRMDIPEMLEHRGYGHLGGSLSIVELTSVLYGKQLRMDPKNPKMEDRDMVILSKGHAGPAWYCALAEKGFFGKEWLMTLNGGDTRLPSHPGRIKTPSVDVTAGSLGQGTSAAVGIVTGLRMKGSDRYVYMIVEDDESNEGRCWEAFQYVAHYKLNNCIVIIDDNKRQFGGYTKDVMNPFSIPDKMKAFGFDVQVVRGNDIEAIDAAIEQTKAVKDQAVCIVLDTIKGQGVPYFEEMVSSHSVKFNSDEVINETHKAIADLK